MLTQGDINRWEAEIDGWRQRYEALVKAVVDQQSIMLPRMLADQEVYELGRLHGAAAERKAIIDIVAFHGGSVEIEADIRSRGES